MDIDVNSLDPKMQEVFYYVSSLGVFDLRALARVFGQVSATVTSRDENLTFLMEKIIEGKDLPVLPLRKGRPHKDYPDLKKRLRELSEITGRNYTLRTIITDIETDKPKDVGFNQTSNARWATVFPIMTQGMVVEKNGRTHFYLDKTNEKIYVKDPRYNLHDGDVVIADLIYNTARQSYELKNVDAVNYALPDEKNIPKASPSVTLNNKTKITLGSQYRIDLTQYSDDESAMRDLVLELNKNNVVCLAVAMSESAEEANRLEGIEYDFILHINKSDSANDTVKKVNYFIRHLEKLDSEGRSVAIFYESLDIIASKIDREDLHSRKIFYGHTENCDKLLKALLKTNKTSKNSRTVFVSKEEDESSPLAKYINQNFKTISVR